MSNVTITADPFADTLGGFVKPTIRRTARPIVVDMGAQACGFVGHQAAKGGEPIARTIAREALRTSYRNEFARRFDAGKVAWVGDVATPVA